MIIRVVREKKTKATTDSSNNDEKKEGTIRGVYSLVFFFRSVVDGLGAVQGAVQGESLLY